MKLTRRTLLTGIAGTVGTSALAGCIGGDSSGNGSETNGPVAQSTFFVFGDITANVAGDTARAELLVPVGQHGHGWEPGVQVREDIRGADLLVHGMEGFQPWVDTIRSDLDADDATVQTVDVSAGLDLLEPGGGHDEENHDDDEDDHDHGEGMDPHFWMDPLRVSDAVDNVRQGLTDVDTANEDAYVDNAEAFQSELADLHDRIESTVADGSTGVVLVAGHDSFQYLADRYGIQVEALTNVSPDDRPTTRDIQRAREVIETHDLRYICADPLESQQAAEQLVAETDAEAVLPLTAMPGLTDEWSENDWGYVDVMENVNLPTLEDALEA
jgi:zinc transport system substrate-binding protein